MVNLQILRKIKRSLRVMEYYFLRQPFYALRRTDRAYGRMKAFTGKRIERERIHKVAANLETVFGQERDEETFEDLSKRYFEILSCDDLDAWLWLLKPWKQRRKHVMVEDEAYFREVADQKRGCILLSSHFGGGFFIFEVAKELGGKPQGFGQPIKREYFKGDFFRWVYLKFRTFCVERAIGEKIIYTGRRETGKEFLEKLEKGYHVVVFFDVPPTLVKGRVETVDVLGKDWNFPRGFLKVIAGKEIPVVPFFSCLTEENKREFRFFPPFRIQNRDEVKDALQTCARLFERQLLKRPEQWFFWEGAEVFW
jgi:lauroyl/myristoyl acyltransferase